MNSKFNLNFLQELYTTNSKRINIVGISLLIIIGSIYYYFNFYKTPREEKANEAIFHAQSFFKIDSFDLALNGSGNQKGFLYIIKQFSGTEAANLAHYYAGIIYLKTAKFQKAIDLLNGFSSKNIFLEGYANGALADAYAEVKNFDKAVTHYKKAGKLLKDDNIWGAENFLKAAMLLEVQQKNNDAIEAYKELRKLFPESKQSKLAEKYLLRLGYQE